MFKFRAKDSISNWHEFGLFDVLGYLESDHSYFLVTTTKMRLICSTVEMIKGGDNDTIQSEE